MTGQNKEGSVIMAQTLVNIRMDEELKKNMEQTCQELGMNMTTAITIFAKKMIREKGFRLKYLLIHFIQKATWHICAEVWKRSMPEMV